MNVVTHDRIEFDKLLREWLETIPERERLSSTTVMGAANDLRPMFLNVPEAFVRFLHVKGFEFDVQA